MRCYFYIEKGGAAVQFGGGFDVPDIVTMQNVAQQAVQALRTAAERNKENWQSWRLNVVDESGSILLSISLNNPSQYSELYDTKETMGCSAPRSGDTIVSFGRNGVWDNPSTSAPQ